MIGSSFHAVSFLCKIACIPYDLISHFLAMISLVSGTAIHKFQRGFSVKGAGMITHVGVAT